MRKYILFILFMVVVGLGSSMFLIPNEEQLALMQKKDEHIRTMGYVDYQAEYDRGIRSEPIIVGLASLYIGEGRAMDAMPILEQHVKENPTHVEARKKLAELYQAAGRDEDYLREMEFVAETQPSEENLKLLADVYNYVKLYDKQSATLTKLIEVSKGSKPEYYVDQATMLTLMERRQEATEVLIELRKKHPEHMSFKLARLIVGSLVDEGETERAYEEARSWLSNPAAQRPAQDEDDLEEAEEEAAKKAGEKPEEIRGRKKVKREPLPAGPDPREIADLANIINYGGRPDLSLKLIEERPEFITREETLFTAYVNASLVTNNRDKAYMLLGEAYQKETLPSPLYRPYIQLAVERDDVQQAELVAERIDRRYFSEDDAINLLELSRIQTAPTPDVNDQPITAPSQLVNKLLVAFDHTDYTVNKPALIAYMALIRRDTDEDMKIANALKSDLTGNSRLRLAEACARENKEQCFDSLVARFPSFKEMTPREVDEVAMLFISVDKQSRIYEPVSKLADETDSNIIDYAVIKLAASLGKTEVVKPWLEKNRTLVETAKLNDLFFLANDRRHGEIALQVAEILYDREPSQKHGEYLVSAYFNAGMYAKALPFLRELKAQSRAHEDMYLATLTKLAKSDPELKSELEAYVIPQLDSPTTPIERKLELVFMLINSGNKERALPYIDQYAESEGGEWKKISAQVHNKYFVAGASGKSSGSSASGSGRKSSSSRKGTARGKGASSGTAVASAAPATPVTPAPVEIPLIDQPKEYRLQLALNPKTNNDTRRMLAFSLIDDGFHDEAAHVFEYMARDKGPNSPEVKDLLYMWGPRLNESQIAWIGNRADTAQGGDVVRWGEIITTFGDDYALMNYVSRHPQALSYPSIRDKYLRALAVNGSAESFDKGMNDWVRNEQDPQALIDYATIAKAYGQPAAAIRALKKVDRMDPANEQVLKDLGILSFSQSSYADAERYLDAYFNLISRKTQPETEPFEAYFFKGELLRRKKMDQMASRYFAQVLQDGPAVATDAQRQSMYYSSQFHLGYTDTAKDGFFGLMERYPEDKALLADYLSILLEYHFYDEATAVANQYDRNSPYYQGRLASVLPVESPHIANIESFEQGRELKISFDRPLSELDPKMLASLSGSTLPWLDKTQAGYDSILIAAKPGTLLRFTPASEEMVAIVPHTQMGRSSEEELKRQQDLRLQLLYARMELETGQEQAALSRLHTLDEHYPQNVELKTYTANAENYTGNWSRALGLLKKHRACHPTTKPFVT